MGRFDNRSKEQFKKDIKYSTMIEKFWVEYLDIHLNLENGTAHSSKSNSRINIFDNGTDNTGEYQEKSNGNADYVVMYPDGRAQLLEVKWCPTYGKISLKKYDMKNYIEQGADIFFIMNMNRKVSLKKPKDGDWEAQQELMKQAVADGNIKWCITSTEDLIRITNEIDITKIPWMGGKHGYILKEKEINKYMNWRKFNEL